MGIVCHLKDGYFGNIVNLSSHRRALQEKDEPYLESELYLPVGLAEVLAIFIL